MVLVMTLLWQYAVIVSLHETHKLEWTEPDKSVNVIYGSDQ